MSGSDAGSSAGFVMCHEPPAARVKEDEGPHRRRVELRNMKTAENDHGQQPTNNCLVEENLAKGPNERVKENECSILVSIFSCRTNRQLCKMTVKDLE